MAARRLTGSTTTQWPTSGYFNVTFENEGPSTVTIPLYGHNKVSGTITDLNDVGSSYGYTSGKFNISSTPTSLVTNGL